MLGTQNQPSAQYIRQHYNKTQAGDWSQQTPTRVYQRQRPSFAGESASISEYLLQNVQAQLMKEEELKAREEAYTRKLAKIRDLIEQQNR